MRRNATRLSYSPRDGNWVREVVRSLGSRHSEWHIFSGGGMTHPVLVRFGQLPSGRIACTGVILGAENLLEDDGMPVPPWEVRSTSLRDVPLGGIRKWLSEDKKYGPGIVSAMLGDPTPLVVERSAVRRGREFSREELQAFAADINRERAIDRRGWTARLARRWHVSEATVLYRKGLCLAAELIPRRREAGS